VEQIGARIFCCWSSANLALAWLTRDSRVPSEFHPNENRPPPRIATRNRQFETHSRPIRVMPFYPKLLSGLVFNSLKSN
jgi:hypothetical protein